MSVYLSAWDHSCPKCGAGPGQPCYLPSGEPWQSSDGEMRLHRARVLRAQMATRW